MAETGQLAAWVGREKGFEIREYPVPDPAPGAALIKVALANVCGSDIRHWNKILSHTFPLEKINEAFRQQEDGHITRGAIPPN
jgi:Zn-dependent alcohol dehydrogenase